MLFGVDETYTNATGLAVIVTAVTALLGVLFKYLTDRKAKDQDDDNKLIDKLQKRIDALEVENKSCMERNTQLSQRVGYLEAKCELLENKLNK